MKFDTTFVASSINVLIFSPELHNIYFAICFWQIILIQQPDKILVSSSCILSVWLWVFTFDHWDIEQCWWALFMHLASTAYSTKEAPKCNLAHQKPKTRMRKKRATTYPILIVVLLPLSWCCCCKEHMEFRWYVIGSLHVFSWKSPKID